MEQLRPPIVTILGHVDHGKTTLLDFIRKSSVAAKEHGGITQHIGAYQISLQAFGSEDFGRASPKAMPAARGELSRTAQARRGTGDSGQQNKKSSELKPETSNLITFIDTPGHAAFEKMRSRGANVADIAVLVVAADDGVMTQTVEAIKHILKAKVPMIVAVNKIDVPGIDLKVQLERIKKQLSDNGVLIEEYGGDVPIIQLSAKTGEGVDKLLEMINLVAEMQELKADPDREPAGVVIEANLDKFKGPIATILIRDGSLKKGDQIMLGGVKSKIRGMFDFNAKPLDVATPSTPVEILGLESVPAVGTVLGQEAAAVAAQKVSSLVDRLRAGESKSLKVVIKADKQGSLEAIQDGLEKMNPAPAGAGQARVVEIVGSGTGDIGEADIKLASGTKAIVIGFNVKTAPVAGKLAETEKVLIRTYNIIYELLDEMEEVMEGMIRPGEVEENLGKANIIAEFPLSSGGRIAGCRLTEGYITKGIKVKILRDGEVIGEAKVANLRKVKEEVQRVDKGSDCGIVFDPQVDFVIGDSVESFRII